MPGNLKKKPDLWSDSTQRKEKLRKEKCRFKD
jgi:hypothetical protein